MLLLQRLQEMSLSDVPQGRLDDQFYSTLRTLKAKVDAKPALIEITNVYQYAMHEIVEQGNVKLITEWCPNAAPLFPDTWFECQIPGGRLGWLFSAEAIKPMDREAFAYYAQVEDNDQMLDMWYGAKWRYTITATESRGDMATPLIGVFRTYVFADGRPTDAFVSRLFVTPSRNEKEREDATRWETERMQGLVIPMLAIAFAHCKNVGLEEVEPSPKLQKARQRRKKTPLIKYYTLTIDPMKRVLRTEGGSEEVGLKRALHICRGHFANYSEDKPLFGKLSGRFWIPAHVRGSKDAGIIQKDYKVKV